jgi:REP element-mobilizing transposase RayT
LFGDVVDLKMRLNDFGETTQACWTAIPDHIQDIQLDEFIVMPNHLHGLIVVGRGMACHAPTSNGRIQ